MDFVSLALGVTLYAVTNVDDLFVLLGFFSDRRFHPHQVVIGQYLGMTALIGASLMAAWLSLALPPAYVGLLGLAPLAIGLKKLYDLRAADRNGVPEAHDASHGNLGNVLSVAAVTIANGGDNIGVYAPLFATQSPSATTTVVATFLVMTAVWCLASRWLVNHRRIGAPIRSFGHAVLPFVLIGLGCFILYESGSFGLIR